MSEELKEIICKSQEPVKITVYDEDGKAIELILKPLTLKRWKALRELQNIKIDADNSNDVIAKGLSVYTGRPVTDFDNIQLDHLQKAGEFFNQEAQRPFLEKTEEQNQKSDNLQNLSNSDSV